MVSVHVDSDTKGRCESMNTPELLPNVRPGLAAEASLIET